MINPVVQILELIAVGATGLVALIFLLCHPEISFAFFIAAYVIKGGINIGYFNLTAIFLLVTLLGFFLPAIKGKPIRFSLKSADFWLFIFLIVLFGGTYLVPNPAGGVTKASLFAVAVVLPYLIARIFFKTYNQVRIFLITLLASAVIIASALIVMSFSPSYTGGRLSFFEANVIPTGTLLAVGLIIAVIGLTSKLFGKSRKIKILCVIVSLLCLYGIFLSGVRGPLISIIVGLTFYFLILSLHRLRVLVSISAIAILLLVTSNMWYPSAAKALPNIGGYRLQAITQGLSTQDRLERYRAAIELFTQSPLLGVGTDGYAELTGGLGYPHNIFLEIASENGLIGLIAFISFLGTIFWYGLKWLINSAHFDPQVRAIGVTVLVVALTLLVEKQFSYGLTMHKDLFAFLGLVVNLPLIARTARPSKESTTQ